MSKMTAQEFTIEVKKHLAILDTSSKNLSELMTLLSRSNEFNFSTLDAITRMMEADNKIKQSLKALKEIYEIRGKSKLNEDHVKLCGVEFSNYRKTKIAWPPMDQLLAMIGEHGQLQTSRMLGVSDSGLRLHIKKHKNKEQRISNEVSSSQ